MLLFFRRSFEFFFPIVPVSFVFLLLWGCSNNPSEQVSEKPPTQEPPPRVAIPIHEALYRQNGCESCHGKYGYANPARNYPQDMVDFRKIDSYKHGSDRNAIRESIRRGIPGTKMLGYEHLTDYEINKIVDYIEDLQKIANP